MGILMSVGRVADIARYSLSDSDPGMDAKPDCTDCVKA